MTEGNALKLVPSVIKVICAETFVSSINSVIRIKKKERECPFFFLPQFKTFTKWILLFIANVLALLPFR